MNAFRNLGLGLAFALLAACGKPPPPAPVIDLAAETEAIKGRSMEWQKLAGARAAAPIVASIFAADAATIYDGNVRKGAPEIQASLEADFAAAPQGTISWTTTEIHVAASGDLAYERGTLSEDPDGDGPKPAKNGEFVTVWSKIEGTWRVVVDAGTVGQPAGG